MDNIILSSSRYDQRRHRVCEFYSGLGGFHAAVDATGVPADVVHAFDVNDIANAVYRHNYPTVCVQTNDVVKLSTSDLDSLQCNIWLLSPPCQPYTRKGLKMGSEDVRAVSFLAMLDRISDMNTPPDYVLVENVLGFEKSSTYLTLTATMQRNKYTFYGFVLNSISLGVPNSRPRFYFLAKRDPLVFPNNIAQYPIGTIFDGDNATSTISIVLQKIFPKAPRSLDQYLEHMQWSDDLSQHFGLSNVSLWKGGDHFDIVGPHQTRSCCFTKAYGQFASGAGSVISHCDDFSIYTDKSTPIWNSYRLCRDQAKHIADIAACDAMRAKNKKVPPSLLNGDHNERQKLTGNAAKVFMSARSGVWDELDVCPLTILQLRYFTDREVCRLLGFPDSFSFPAEVSLTQRWRLLGNSLSVTVVSVLLQLLLI